MFSSPEIQANIIINIKTVAIVRRYLDRVTDTIKDNFDGMVLIQDIIDNDKIAMLKKVRSDKNLLREVAQIFRQASEQDKEIDRKALSQYLDKRISAILGINFEIRK